ncbi:MAG: restriction endonuclease subunit M [Planctomycetes bacterium]|nr:restriction endonuclease subunit M [Planctomycetota bacterium]
MPAPQVVVDLVERYRLNAGFYESGAYREAELRQEFVEPFFKALGWDMANEQGLAESLKYVVHEEALRVGGATKAPDYTFRIGGTRMFFLEVKNPSIRIGEDVEPAFQLRRYAWSAKLPVSILTSFREFAAYHRCFVPKRTDRSSVARTLFLSVDDYVARWDEIASIFSCQAVWRGSLERYVKSKEIKGTTEVDDAFLAEIESWRDALARHIALRNDLTQNELNSAVQATIDRIVFLRMCEDRGIESYGRLQALLDGEGVYRRLFALFERADERYNSGLFHFQREPGRAEPPDTLTRNLAVEDRVLKDILRRLYYPESPYEFSVVRTDILGQVYERFLGKVIRLTAGGRAVVEDKPEVRRAGGVYYTPSHIVDYIVQRTVGRLLAGKTPRQASRTRVLDPACGSGSFLLGAYQHLLDWHLDWYRSHEPERRRRGRQPVVCEAPGGDWRLTVAERKRILLNSIYGVDIDPQAVEVTKLSLLLKVLEGQSGEAIQRQFDRFHERALPDLGANIKCGNSLVDRGFYNNHQMGLFDQEEMLRINPFEWKDEFPEAMAAGGFDAVVGNPPYVRIQVLKQFRPPAEVAYLERHYHSAGRGNYDVSVLFVEKALRLLAKGGFLGCIVPHKFLKSHYGQPLRELIAAGKHLAHVVHFGAHQVFRGPTTYTCLLFLDQAGTRRVTFAQVDDLDAWIEKREATEGVVRQPATGKGEWNFVVGSASRLFKRLSHMPAKLGQVADVFVGVQTSADDVYLLEKAGETRDRLMLRTRSLARVWAFEKGLLHPIVSGTDVRRYCPLPERQYVIFPYRVAEGVAEVISFDTIERDFPRTAAYLSENRKRLESREKGKGRGPHWHRYVYPKNLARQSVPKVCVPRLVDRLHAAFDPDGSHFLDNVDVGGITLKAGHTEQGLLYLLGLLNSRLLAWYFPFVSAPFRGGWRSANRQFLSQLPIRAIDFSCAADRERHERVVRLVGHMQALHRQLAAARTPHRQTALQRQIAATDGQIDRLVYELYDLTEDEIRIVESPAPGASRDSGA